MNENAFEVFLLSLARIFSVTDRHLMPSPLRHITCICSILNEAYMKAYGRPDSL
jgi:hypothetical protein